MAVTVWRAFTQLDSDVSVTTATTLAARTIAYDLWMNGEAQKRGITLSWGKTLPWLLSRVGLDPTTIPTIPTAGSPSPTSGQGWPR